MSFKYEHWTHRNGRTIRCYLNDNGLWEYEEYFSPYHKEGSSLDLLALPTEQPYSVPDSIRGQDMV